MTDLPLPKKTDIKYYPISAPIFDGMPAHLKDPKNYPKINKVVLETLAGKCSHGEVIEWASCSKCQRRFMERGQILKKLGFKSSAQYMAWKKTHEEIIKRTPPEMYKKMISENITI